MLAFMEHYDLIVCPVSAYPAVPHGATADIGDGFTYTRIFNLTGWPGCSCPGRELAGRFTPLGCSLWPDPGGRMWPWPWPVIWNLSWVPGRRRSSKFRLRVVMVKWFENWIVC